MPQDETELDPDHIRELSAGLQRLADELANPPAPAAPVREVTPAVVRGVIAARRLRERYFDPKLFSDPAWDMLLELLLAKLEERPVTVSSLCFASNVPQTTALRWVKSLTDAGLAVRIPHERDARRVLLELSEEAEAGLLTYFATAVATEDAAEG